MLAVHLSSPACEEQWLFRNDVQEFDLGPLRGIVVKVGPPGPVFTFRKMALIILPKQRLALRRAAACSYPVNSVSSPSKEFESPLDVPPINDINAFLSVLRFEIRNLLAELFGAHVGDDLKRRS